MDLVIVESGAKAKTIQKYLGKNVLVRASNGHVQDLPNSGKEGSKAVWPNKKSKLPEPSWSWTPRSENHIKRILSDSRRKKVERVLIATDPDREGEAIAWHVLQALKEKGSLKDKEVSRVTFNAITKKIVTEAIVNPRELDTELIDAYLARRALDYLVGFTLSPVLWRKLPGARSAGRVQSVALRLLCEREIEIESFDPKEYWPIFFWIK